MTVRYLLGDTRDVCDAVGIDIDERNVELARERCGMFLETD